MTTDGRLGGANQTAEPDDRVAIGNAVQAENLPGFATTGGVSSAEDFQKAATNPVQFWMQLAEQWQRTWAETMGLWGGTSEPKNRGETSPRAIMRRAVIVASGRFSASTAFLLKKIRRRARNTLSRRRPVSNWIPAIPVVDHCAMAMPRRYDIVIIP